MVRLEADAARCTVCFSTLDLKEDVYITGKYYCLSCWHEWEQVQRHQEVALEVVGIDTNKKKFMVRTQNGKLVSCTDNLLRALQIKLGDWLVYVTGPDLQHYFIRSKYCDQSKKMDSEDQLRRVVRIKFQLCNHQDLEKHNSGQLCLKKKKKCQERNSFQPIIKPILKTQKCYFCNTHKYLNDYDPGQLRMGKTMTCKACVDEIAGPYLAAQPRYNKRSTVSRVYPSLDEVSKHAIIVQ